MKFSLDDWWLIDEGLTCFMKHSALEKSSSSKLGQNKEKGLSKCFSIQPNSLSSEELERRKTILGFRLFLVKSNQITEKQKKFPFPSLSNGQMSFSCFDIRDSPNGLRLRQQKQKQKQKKISIPHSYLRITGKRIERHWSIITELFRSYFSWVCCLKN